MLRQTIASLSLGVEDPSDTKAASGRKETYLDVLIKYRAFSLAQRFTSAGGTSTSCPEGTTLMNGCTCRSKWSTLIPSELAAS